MTSAAIPAISLHQPWASLLFVPDFKAHETRSWPYPDALHGRRILVQAAKRRPVLDALCPSLRELIKSRGLGLEDFPLGAFVGSARLSGCFRTDQFLLPTEPDLLVGDFGPGRFAWRLLDRRPLRKPLSAMGRQGFWYLHRDTLPDDILKEHDL